jgi:hypothetical protein
MELIIIFSEEIIYYGKPLYCVLLAPHKPNKSL